MTLVSRVSSLLVLLCVATPFFRAVEAGAQVPSAVAQVMPWGPELPGGVMAFPRDGNAQALEAWRARRTAQRMARHTAGQTQSVHRLDAPANGSAVIETLAGSAPSYASLSPVQVGLGRFQGLAQDAAGDLFVSTGDLGTVLKINPAGVVSVYAGTSLPVGPKTASGDGGPATAARLVKPSGLALDTVGNLYIADEHSCTVRMVAANTGIITTVAGSSANAGHAGDGGPATSALLNLPSSVALDGNGNLFISESEFVREVNLANGTISTIAGTNNYNSESQCNLNATQACPATEVSLELEGSSILAIGQGVLNIAAQGIDVQNFGAGAVVSINLSTGMMQIVAGGYSAAAVPGNAAIGVLIIPVSVAVDHAGNLDVGDGLGTIQQLPPNRLSIRTIAGDNQQPGFSGDGGPATSAEVYDPQALIVTSSGNLLFADLDHIRSINAAGTINTIAGNGFPNFFGDGGSAKSAGLDFPGDVAIDAQGNVYIADEANEVVRRIDHATGMITTVAGNGGNAFQDGLAIGSVGDGGLATQAEIGTPVSLALDGAGHLFISVGYAVRSVDLASGVISTLVVSNDDYYQTIVFDGNHTLYLVCGYQVLAFNMQTGASVAMTAGSGRASGDGGPSVNATGYPSGLALDGKGSLYFSDSGNENIRVINLSTGIIETMAGAMNGAAGYTGDGGSALAATFNQPTGLRFDAAGHLLITDTGNHAIRQIDLTTNVITTVAGDGSAGFTGDGGAPAAATLYYPQAIAFDATGNMYIADSENDRVRRVVVGPTVLTSALSASLTNAPQGENISVTATYSGQFFGVAPTGTVTFLDGTVLVGTGNLTEAANGDYVATFNLSSLALGSHAITAKYAGDAHYTAATSAAVMLVVTAPVAPSFTLTAAPASLTVVQGASGTAVFTLTPAGGFKQAVALSCGSGLPTGVTCSFSPASLTPTTDAAVTTTLTVTTTGATSARLHVPLRGQERRGCMLGAASVACLLMFGLPSRRRAARTWLGVLVCVVVLGLTAGCSGSGAGSGGGSGGGTGGGTPSDATPVGAYTISLTGVSGSLSQAVSFKLTVTN